MENKTINASTIDFIQKHVPVNVLSSFLPIDGDTVYDLIHEIELSVEAPLVLDQEEGNPVDVSILNACSDVIDDLNRDPDLIDFDFLNKELLGFVSK